VPNENGYRGELAKLDTDGLQKERQRLENRLRATWRVDLSLGSWKSKVSLYCQSSHRPFEKLLFETASGLERVEAETARHSLAYQANHGRALLI
jgi:hypothetical protein